VANILSQDEVDALLSSFSEEEESEAESTEQVEGPDQPAAERSVSVFDFRRPNRISKDQLRLLEALHESFLMRFTGVLSGYLRTMVDMEIVSLEQLTYGEWVRSLPEVTCVFPFSMEPLQGSGAIEMSPGLGLSIVDRLLGGQGSDVDHARDLTHLETTLVSRIASQMLTVLCESWSEIVKFTPKLEGFEKQPNLLKLLPDPETVVLITFELKTQTLNGSVTLCYPFVALEPALTKAGEGAFASRAIRVRQIAEGPEWLAKGIEEGYASVGARLGQGTVTIEEFVRLRKGDVIRLDGSVRDPVEIDVGGIRKFFGRPGRSGKRIAVEIVGRIREVEGGDTDDGRCSGTPTGDERGRDQ
jgi:flagellar motor switch protein FliM